MKAYLDLMLVNQLLMGIGALHMEEKLLCKKEKWRKTIGISILLSLRILAIYFNVWVAYLAFTAYELAIFLIFYKREGIKRFLIYTIYTAIVTFFTLLIFKNDIGMRNQVLVIREMTGGFAIILQPLLYLFTDLSTLAVDKLYRLRDYKIDVLISSGNEDRVIKAYYDSGNTLSFSQSPVIFIKKGTMNFDPRDEVDVDINLKLPYYPEKAYQVLVNCGPRKENYSVLAFVVKKEADFYGCDCLFNALIRR